MLVHSLSYPTQDLKGVCCAALSSGSSSFLPTPKALQEQSKSRVMGGCFHTGCSYLNLATSFPWLLAKRCYHENTQLALCLRVRQARAAGDVPLPIKINGTKLPCVLHEFYLPGSLVSSVLLLSLPSGLSCPLGVFWHRLKDNH
jgi:hypothetical protein